jgi:hypothetical protein
MRVKPGITGSKCPANDLAVPKKRAESPLTTH